MRISLKRLGILAGAMFLAASLFFLLIPYLFPFLMGAILSLLFEPIVTRIAAFTHFPRWLSVLIILLLFLLLLGGGFTYLIGRITSELFIFAMEVPRYIDRFTHLLFSLFPRERWQRFYDDLISWYSAFYPAGEEEIKRRLADWANRGEEYILLLIQHFLEGFLSLLLRLPQIAATFFLSLLASFFISLDLPQWIGWIKERTPRPFLFRMMEVKRMLKEGVLEYGKAQLLLATLSALATTVGLLLLHLKYAFLLGIIAGFFDLIPFVGVGTLFIPWLFYLFFTGNHSLVIGLAILFIIITLLRQFLEPRLVANSLGLAPILTMMALFLGLQWFGFLGFLLAPFTLILLLSLYRAGLFHDLWNYLQEKNGQ
ncbi:MAG: sporulation integral membrane protein YtvI [Thermicanus sp.]|nr:sporulation integral membrane protein YtvI [Thermicanus sp.]